MKKVYLVYPKITGMIAPEIYGHFSEHIGGVFYGGLYVGENSDVPNISGFHKGMVEKLKAINPPVLRWPGGCFAETYDWRDGIGENRPKRVNWWTEKDGRYESNDVGTHEFMKLCELIDAKAYFAANLTSSTPLSVRNWMDYCLSPENTTSLAQERKKNGHSAPFDIPFWGVGNENWGGGGNMRPEFYADEYRRYASVMKNLSPSSKLIVCGANADCYEWTDRVLANIKPVAYMTSGYSVHYYCGGAGDPINFTNDDWTQLMKNAQRTEEILCRHWSIIEGHGLTKECKLYVDEWGCWHPEGSGPSKGYNLFEQQNTMRDAMVAALTLNIFNNNCDKIAMANIAQVCNNLHSLFLSDGDKFTVTPTYHIFDMYKEHQGAKAIETVITENDDFEQSITVSASVKDGKTLITVGNLSPENEARFTLSPVGEELPDNAKLTLLCSEDLHSHNTFESPNAVSPVETVCNPNEPITLPKGAVAAIYF